ncbi:DUF2974 domain-containing protein [Candidatus Dependentiae bacterium]|nr:DUF2974 domain-containing protein [Candidatus Dependentiae bacterium]
MFKKSIIFQIFLIFISINTLPACFFKKREKVVVPNLNSEKNVTIFVHGTLPPLIAKLANKLDCPIGLTRFNDMSIFSFTKRIAKAMHKTDPEQFNLNNFHFFGWSGKLSFEERKKAAEHLYNEIKKVSGKIILIGHSHGGNVALHLAEVAEKNNDTSLQIDKLVLMGTPVQHVTEHLANSDIFKKVISLFSRTDNIQVLDPQGLYKETQQIDSFKKYFFSQRMFNNSDKVIHARVLFNKSNPSHIDFITPKFAKFIPDILKIVERQSLTSDQIYTINLNNNQKIAHIVHLKKFGSHKKYI